VTARDPVGGGNQGEMATLFLHFECHSRRVYRKPKAKGSCKCNWTR